MELPFVFKSGKEIAQELLKAQDKRKSKTGGKKTRNLVSRDSSANKTRNNS
jgi:hypothetical protein